MKTPGKFLDDIDLVSNGGRLPPELGSSYSVLPKKFGRYEVVRELGKGAMGIVYLGRDPVIGRLVALKTIRAIGDDEAEQREFGERFLREAQAAGILSHPNIVTVHDVGEDPDTHTSFIAMEYVEGKNLKQLVQEKTPYTFERIAEIIGQVAEALDYAHRKGIVHRDVKPANIIITSEGAVKITDFGIAKIEQSNLTSTGQFLGTPNYMSPEQVTGDSVDGRSDLFSLGVCLYELLTKKKPFSGDNLTSISYKIVHESFTPPEVYDATIPPEFGPTLQKGLAKDPAGRFQRGNDFALSLYEFKARQEERQMLRDLGQMVAEAENLGAMSSVQVSPVFPSPSTPASGFPAPVHPSLAAIESKPEASGSGSRSEKPHGSAEALIAELSPSGSSSSSKSSSFELGEAKGPVAPVFAPTGNPAAKDVDVSAPDWTIDEVAIPPPPRAANPTIAVPDARPELESAVEVEDSAEEPDWWIEATADPVADGESKDSSLHAATEEPSESNPRNAAPGRSDSPSRDLPELGDGMTERLDLRSALGLGSPKTGGLPTSEFTERMPLASVAVPPTAPSRANVFDDGLENRPTEFIKDAAELARMGAPRPAPPPSSVTPPAPPVPKIAPPPPPVASVRDSLRDVKSSDVKSSDVKSGAKANLRTDTPPPAPPAKRSDTEKTPSVVAAGKSVSREQKASTTATMKRHVSTKFVLLILGGVLVIGGVIVGILLRQKSSIATVATVAPVEDELAKETAERRTLLTDGERFLKEGKSEEALKNFRELVRRSPGSAPAREALARAEALAVIQQESAGKARQVEEHLAAAREASLVPDDAKAISESDFALAIDPANTEAQTLKAAALERLSKKTLADQKKIKDELAARKKAKAKPVATAAPAVVAAAPRPAPEPAGAPSPTPAVANVRVAFQSPISRGLLMIGLNDKIVFRKDFDFGKNGTGGVVDGTVSLRSGPGTLKVWVLSTDRSFKPYRAVDLSVPGDAKSLKIDLDSASNFSVAFR